jgi:nicotinate dehydrogenase subunit A
MADAAPVSAPPAGSRIPGDGRPLVLSVNGTEVEVEAAPETPLLLVLRNELGLTAAKFGCGLEQCHACAVLVDGEVRPSCATAAAAFEGAQITTPEGLDATRLRDAFVAEQAAQCGYCIPGILVSAAALLARNPQPSDGEIREALAPHLCRCGSHPRIVKAVARAARA